MNDIAEIAERALAAFLTRAETLGAEAGAELLATLKRAGENLQGLLALAVEGEVTTGEVLAATHEIRETVEGAIAGEVFEGQRDIMKLLLNVADEFIPVIAKVV